MHKLTKDLVSEDDQRKLGIMSQKFMDYSPDFKGAITPEESVMKMIEVIKSKGIQHSGTFWTYENKVSKLNPHPWIVD